MSVELHRLAGPLKDALPAELSRRGMLHVSWILYSSLCQVPDDQQYIDLRVSVLGSFDVGKSTLLGVLTQGELDNGRGRARLNMFRHLHEIQSGG